MTDKKIKNQKNTTAIPQEDIQLYRLFLIFGVAILGFAGLRRIPEAEGAFLKILEIGQWIALALLVVSIAAFVYIRFVKKIDESGKVITSTGVAYFLFPILFMLSAYRYFENANAKFQLLFALIAIFAVIYNIFRREFKNITAITFICAIGLYYAATPVYDVVEKIFSAVAQAVMVALPAFVIALLICAFSQKNGVVRFKNHKIYELPSKFGGILGLIISSALFISALILLFVPVAFTYVMVTLLAIYVVFGIICTIRLI